MCSSGARSTPCRRARTSRRSSSRWTTPGGLAKYHNPGYWKSFKNVCQPYDGPQLVDGVTACDAPDGSYWAVQSWQRLLPMRGFDPWKPIQSAYGFNVSHWSGPIAAARRHAELDV